MKQRDTFKDAAYWDRYIQYDENKRIPSHQAAIKNTAPNSNHRVSLQYAIYSARLELLPAYYSRGDGVETLRPIYWQVVQDLAALKQLPGLEEYGFGFFADMSYYVRALWLVALAILLEVSQSEIEMVVELIGNEGKDVLYERLVGLRIKGRHPAYILRYPQPYELLFEALNSEGAAQQEFLLNFIDRYYAGLRNTYWYDRHLSPHDIIFFGYWCFELAAFVKVLGIDDTAFADNIFYPRDLVHPSSE